MPQLLLQRLDLLLFGEEVVQRTLRGQASNVGSVLHCQFKKGIHNIIRCTDKEEVYAGTAKEAHRVGIFGEARAPPLPGGLALAEVPPVIQGKNRSVLYTNPVSKRSKFCIGHTC